MMTMTIERVDDLKAAVRNSTPRIIVAGKRAKRVHRAVSAMKALPDLAQGVLTLEPLWIIAKLVKARVGFRKLNAVRKIGPQFASKLALKYREMSYTEPSYQNPGQCILERREAMPQPGVAKSSESGRLVLVSPASLRLDKPPLTFRAKRGEVDEVKKLLNSGAAIDVQYKGLTPLMYAAEEGHLDVVRVLVERGAAVDLEDDEGKTALDKARGKRHSRVVRYLQDWLARDQIEKQTASPFLNGSWLLCDFHIHTNRSESIASVVDLYGGYGFDAICISDHVYDRQTAARKLENRGQLYGPAEKGNFHTHMAAINREAERALEEYDMLVIPGIEITNSTNKYHIGIIDVKDWIDPDLSVENVIAAAHAQEALAIANHPHRRSSRHLEENWLAYDGLFDAWEIGNRGTIWALGANEGLNQVAGGDFHTADDFYSWKTLVKANKDVESVKEAIRDNSGVAIYLLGKG